MLLITFVLTDHLVYLPVSVKCKPRVQAKCLVQKCGDLQESEPLILIKYSHTQKQLENH